MSIESQIAKTENCDLCPFPPGTRCESSPGNCLYHPPYPSLDKTDSTKPDESESKPNRE